MKKAMVLLVLFAVVCAFACACAEQDTFFSFGAPEPESGASPDAATSHPWTYPIARDLLEDPSGVIRLINRDNLLDKDYPPKDQLVATKVRKTSSTKWLVRDVMALPLETMFGAAEAEGIRLYVESGYRDYSTQKTLYYNRLEKNKGVDDGYVQFPGASEHQSGLCVDIVSKAWSDKKLNEDFAKTKEAQWMAANCARFGFIIRYPAGEDKRAITGIKFEPWHLRYVGIEVASYMTEKELTLEEFTAEYKQALAGAGE